MRAMVFEATPFARGVDTVLRLDQAYCEALLMHQYSFVVRYLDGRYAITPGEMRAILSSGLALMLVTSSRGSGWKPSGPLGKQDGESAGQRLAALDVPADATVWLDYEGDGGAKDDAIAWINAWASSLRKAGYEAGLYVGHSDNELSPEQLWKLKVTRYWRSGSRVQAPMWRGYCMQQLRPLQQNLLGKAVDHNIIEEDHFGHLPRWLVGR